MCLAAKQQIPLFCFDHRPEQGPGHQPTVFLTGGEWFDQTSARTHCLPHWRRVVWPDECTNPLSSTRTRTHCLPHWRRVVWPDEYTNPLSSSLEASGLTRPSHEPSLPHWRRVAWPDQGTNPLSSSLEASTLSITPPIRFYKLGSSNYLYTCKLTMVPI
jgi:hypothetical protein